MGNQPTAEPSNDQLSAFSNYQSSESLSSKPHLIATALSAAYKRTVVTEEEYERRKHEPLFAKVEKLDVQKMADLTYEPATGKFGDVFGESGGKITVCLKSLSGKKIELEVGEDSYVEEIKYLLEEKVEVPIDNDRLVLLYGGKQMKEGCRISDYRVRQRSRYEKMTLSFCALCTPCRLVTWISLNSQPHSGLVLPYHLLWIATC